MPDAFSVTIDASQVTGFLRVAPMDQDRAVKNWLQRGALFLEGAQRRDAARRFGVEQAESRMQSRDPSRPKGTWSGSVSSRLTGDGALVGPNVVYAWWVEQGSQAPRSIPRKNKRSQFRGHRVVERSVKEGTPHLRTLWIREVEDALRRSHP